MAVTNGITEKASRYLSEEPMESPDKYLDAFSVVPLQSKKFDISQQVLHKTSNFVSITHILQQKFCTLNAKQNIVHTHSSRIQLYKKTAPLQDDVECYFPGECLDSNLLTVLPAGSINECLADCQVHAQQVFPNVKYCMFQIQKIFSGIPCWRWDHLPRLYLLPRRAGWK